jgi:signal transduction histidine kinase
MLSLRQRLLAIIGLSLSVLWGLVAVWMFLDMRQELRTALDDRLAASARMVAGLVLQLPSSSRAADGGGASPLDVIARDGLACEVSLLRGQIITQTMAKTAGSPGLSKAPTGFGTHHFGGKPWRTYVLAQNGIRIATADRLDVRDALLRDMALSVGVPFVVALGGSLMLLWFGIGKGLAPIERVRSALAQRSPDDPTPLPETDAPQELRSLVDTIGHLLEKVRGAIERERRFTDDAAHELRTPLTAIKTHLQVARLAHAHPQATDTVSQSMLCADQGVIRLQGTLDQLLLLARLDGRADQPMAERTEASTAARQAIDDASAAPDVAGRLVVSALADVVYVAVPEALLMSALRNLLDNALRYSPPTGQVELRLELEAAKDRVCFRVLDEGPGLNDEECAQATRRFWRRDASRQGSGLGLSIVQAIAERHGGELILKRRQGGGGLDVRLHLPVVAEPEGPL